jgi:hypothetical protein
VGLVGEMTPNRAYAAQSLLMLLWCFGEAPKRRKNEGPKHFDQLLQNANLACEEVGKVVDESRAV